MGSSREIKDIERDLAKARAHQTRVRREYAEILRRNVEDIERDLAKAKSKYAEIKKWLREWKKRAPRRGPRRYGR